MPAPADVRTIDGTGLAACPGFIDTHSHSELALLSRPVVIDKVRQGVTTEILGQDGLGVLPVPAAENAQSFLKDSLVPLAGRFDVEWTWSDLAGYAAAASGAGVPLNVATLVPQGNLRLSCVGLRRGESSRQARDFMAGQLREAMAQGAVGLSSGLIYVPSLYATPDELIELCRVVAEAGGVFAVHIRNESDRILIALKEVVDIARASGVALHVSHLKVSGQPCWPLYPKVEELLLAAREEGISVSCDVYPYTAGCTALSALLPPWAKEDGLLLERLSDPRRLQRIWADLAHPSAEWENIGLAVGWENILVSGVESERNAWAQGQSIAGLAKAKGVGPGEALTGLLRDEEGKGNIILFQGSEEILERILRLPFSTVCTDGVMGGRKLHPRVFGSFPRLLGRYVRERKVLSLAEAVWKATGFPAQRFGLQGRGVLKAGNKADLVLFDPETIQDAGTFQEPETPPRGIRLVMVNGVPVIDQGRYTGARSGRFLERRGSTVPQA